MAKEYIESGRASLTGEFISRKGAVAYGEFYSDRRPDADDDELAGFAEGSVWHYVDRQRVYICVDPTEGAAVWRDLRDAAKVTVICRNNTGSTITKGSIVYVTGATGNRPTIALADKDSEETSSKTLGMVVADILNNADGSVAVNGTVDDLDTSAYAAGTPLYLGDNGALTATEPVSPAHSVFVGWVAISNANTGRIILHIQNGYELDELHDVLITTPTDGQVLAYEASTSLWKNVTPSGGGGVEVLASFFVDEPISDDGADAAIVTLPAGKLASNGDSLRLKATLQATGTVGTSTITPYFGTYALGSYSFTANGVYVVEVLLTRASNAIFRATLNTGIVASNVYTVEDTVSSVYFDSARIFKLDISTNNANRTLTFKTATVEFLPAP
jgi:transcriptional/translational regulatory protein YebC/TACO1